MNNYVEVCDYSKIIKGNLILDHVNLQLEKGTVTALIGRNGSGKTMLLRAIGGLIHPTEGQIKIDGKIMDSRKAYPDSMGLIIESMKFWPDLTAYDTLYAISRIKKCAGENEIREALTRVGLEPEEKRKVKQFSLGMRQRLAIAQAIFERPQLLLLDEPTNALDQRGVELFHKMIEEERERGATIVLVSHIKEEIAYMADQVYEVEAGRLEQISMTDVK